MKKIVSLSLAGIMALMSIPSTFAIMTGGTCVVCGDETSTICDVCQSYYCENCDPCNYNDWGLGTQVEYVANADASREYTITVPALLRPGQSGTVTLQGMWPSNATVKVTAEDKVEMVNNINSADKKTLAVTFTAIELAGNNTVAVSDDETVSVADISNALFGTWSGKFNYNVDYVAGSGNTGDSGTTKPSDPDTGDEGTTVEPGEGQSTFTIEDDDGNVNTYLTDKTMTWTHWVESEYNTINAYIDGGYVKIDDTTYLSTTGDGAVSQYGMVTSSPTYCYWRKA